MAYWSTFFGSISRACGRDEDPMSSSNTRRLSRISFHSEYTSSTAPEYQDIKSVLGSRTADKGRELRDIVLVLADGHFSAYDSKTLTKALRRGKKPKVYRLFDLPTCTLRTPSTATLFDASELKGRSADISDGVKHMSFCFKEWNNYREWIKKMRDFTKENDRASIGAEHPTEFDDNSVDDERFTHLRNHKPISPDKKTPMATESLIGGEFSTSPPTFTNNSGSKLANLLGLPRDSKTTLTRDSDVDGERSFDGRTANRSVTFNLEDKKDFDSKKVPTRKKHKRKELQKATGRTENEIRRSWEIGDTVEVKLAKFGSVWTKATVTKITFDPQSNQETLELMAGSARKVCKRFDKGTIRPYLGDIAAYLVA